MDGLLSHSVIFGVVLATACSASKPAVVQAVTLPQVSAVSPAAEECAPSKITCGSGRCLYTTADFTFTPVPEQSSACAAGSATACRAFGARTALGQGLPRDDAKARELLERACALHDALACVDASKVRHDETLEGWARRCREGVGEACLEAGNVVRFGADAASHSPVEGARFYERGCKLGVANACMRLAFHAGTGLAMPKDDARMVALYEKACRCGDDTGCSGVAFAYREGRGVPQDLTRARESFIALCDRGVEAACVHLGEMFETGAGVPVDLNRARSLFESACTASKRDREGAQGCSRLGFQYRDGRGVLRNDKAAFDLFEAACHVHEASACAELGAWYRDGRFVPKDASHALELLDNACNHGSDEGCRDAKALR
jgi:TPR repeat protein